jgi:hypothetical protein
MPRYPTKFASGDISARALRKHRPAGFHPGTTSENPIPLTVDDGGFDQRGSIPANQIDDRSMQRPHRGAGFDNPEPDYGNAYTGRGHLDGNLARRSSAPQSGYGRQPDRGVLASPARARAGSANEFWDSSWYGDPPRRQER